MFEPASTSVSCAIVAKPLARSLPPMPSELRQPSIAPTALALPHGHGVPLPSPAQYVLNVP
jgi:hypothetical protein